MMRKKRSKTCACLSSCCSSSDRVDSDRSDLLGHGEIAKHSILSSSYSSCSTTLLAPLQKLRSFFTKQISFSSRKFHKNFIIMSRCQAQRQGPVHVEVAPSQIVRARSSRVGSSSRGSGNESNRSDDLRNELVRTGPRRRVYQPDLNRIRSRHVGPLQGLFIVISSIVVMMFYGRANAVHYACLCLSLYFTKSAQQVTGTSS